MAGKIAQRPLRVGLLLLLVVLGSQLFWRGLSDLEPGRASIKAVRPGVIAWTSAR